MSQVGPGFQTLSETEEKQLTFPALRDLGANVVRGITIDSTAVDAGNTPTTTLRAGLVMGKKTADGLYYQYDKDGVDGTENTVGILYDFHSTLNAVGTAVDKSGSLLLLSGLVKEASCINLDERAKKILWAQGMLFDEHPILQAAGFPTSQEDVSGTALTVVAADNGREFIKTAGAAVTFTLPTIAVGLEFWFTSNQDVNLIIVSAAGNDIVTIGDAAASTITHSTAGDLIGARSHFVAKYYGTTLRWQHTSFGISVVTPT